MGSKLHAVREARGLTQQQIAQKAKITNSMYQRYEYGKSLPNATTAILIAKALNTTVENLFGVATPETEKEPDGNPT